ncbi:hypothetical protein JX265_000806 [Neoarthrinium moseri]|uniref:5-aminolevulinate synthase presequence domain-containing protein n=1 Tax=Neoarthrinium moseri TaxID=1658444 RepID=A0A9P9WWX3_9PEZI|nr:uncharacterized protein JN550_007088 [Neoarthrinium moseri]KAI1847555.1 hypothetical protein JX266_006407 [Neoarthrinium moseri]KAI1867357.1 hypothetical protein JN550_007088 [Neoarthrinium moseri]KAI1880566.1 hypothetical protein JX265_000806 [Neoarthrinium moseri]
MASAAACPVVGTTNSTLPPSHPDIDLSKPGQTCPVVGAKSDHHHNLHQHPSVPLPKDHPDASHADAQKCPVLSKTVSQPKSQAMDDEICPVVGTATTVLPPDHPSTAKASPGDVCPVTKATVGHHKDKVSQHPSVDAAEAGAVCPVTGQKGERH